MEKKVKVKGNGQSNQPAPSDVVITKDKTVVNAAPPPFVSGGQLAGLISNKEMPSALNTLTQPGETPRQLSMRARIGRTTYGTVKGTAMAISAARDREYEDALHEGMILDIMANWVSDEGQGRKETVQAITGERQHEESKAGGGGFLNKFQRAAWGNSSKE